MDHNYRHVTVSSKATVSASGVPEPSWKERMSFKEMTSYGLTEKDMFVELEEEEVEEEEEPAGEE